MPPAVDSPTYPFSAEFQVRLFAAIIRDATFLRRFTDVLKAAYFSHAYCRSGMALVERYAKTYRAAPTLETFRMLLDAEFRKRAPSADVRHAWETFITQLVDADLRDLVYLEGQAVEWARDRVFEQYVLDCAKIVEDAKQTGERQYDLMRVKLQQALRVGLGEDGAFADYFVSTPLRLREYYRQRMGKIPTYFRPLDAALEGGVDRGEEYVIMAPTARGKTTFLIQVGVVGPLFAGQSVLAVTVEMSQLKFEMRVDRCLSLLERRAIEDAPDALLEQIAFVRKFKGQFRCYHYPARKCSVETLEKLLITLRETEGFVPSILVVDYGQILAPTQPYRERRFEIAAIYRELRDLAKERDLALWTAAQTNRGSFTKEVVSLQDAAECIDIVQIADGCFCLCQTTDERESNTCRLYVAKVRDATDNRFIPLTFDRRASRFHLRQPGEAVRARA